MNYRVDTIAPSKVGQKVKLHQINVVHQLDPEAEGVVGLKIALAMHLRQFHCGSVDKHFLIIACDFVAAFVY